MRSSEIINEAVEIRELIEQVSQAVPASLKAFVEKRAEEWRRNAIRDRREKLGYDPYSDTVEDWKRRTGSFHPPSDFKPFDQDEFDRANDRADWTSHEEVIERQLETLIPKEGNSPVYAAMGEVSNALTKTLQPYLRAKFGDPLRLVGGKEEVPIDKVRVQVWWRARSDDLQYGGVYRSRSGNANGIETLLEVVVNREFWRNWLIAAVFGYLTGEGYIYDEFSENIVNTFAHEYAHLEQDIKGQKSYEFSLIPQRLKGRMTRHSAGDYVPGDAEKMLRYFARPAEIDAFATGAAAQVVERIARNFEINAKYSGYRKAWTIRDVSNEDWNEQINGAIRDWAADMPNQEFDAYIRSINARLTDQIPSTIKAKYLHKVKNRFLKTFYARMVAYRRS